MSYSLSQTSWSQAQEAPGPAGSSIFTPSGRDSLGTKNSKKEKKKLIKKLYD